MMMKDVSLNEMLNTLDEEDYNTAVSFIKYLWVSSKRKRAEESQMLLSEIQSIFTDDKGWNSEESMIEDMAKFRKERMGL